MKHIYTCPCGYRHTDKTKLTRHSNSKSCQYTVDDIKKVPGNTTTLTPSRDIVTVLHSILERVSSIEKFLHPHDSIPETVKTENIPKVPKIPDDVWVNIHEAPARFSRIVGIKEDISDNIHTFLQYCEKSKKKVENCVGMLIHRVYMKDEKIRFIVLEDFINKHKIYKRMYPMISFYRDQQLTKDRIVGAFEKIV